MSKEGKDLGKRGEDAAVDFLINKNYTIIERNYNYGNMGEIDIIVKDIENEVLVFVEVKTRENLYFGEPEYGITEGKIKQVKRMAEIYLYQKDIEEMECRFDVIAIVMPEGQEPEIKHYVDAFR